MRNTEAGLKIEVVERDKFNRWFKHNFSDVSPEYLPQFSHELPTDMSEPNQYTIIEGETIMPKAVRVVQSYVLEDSKVIPK